MYLLGYLSKEAKVYLIDKEFGISCYTLNLAIIEYKTLVIRNDLEAAEAILARIPEVTHSKFPPPHRDPWISKQTYWQSPLFVMPFVVYQCNVTPR